MEGNIGRVAGIFFGLFMFFFGLPFTLVPFMMFSDGVIDINYPFESLFMIAFSIPFLMAGLFVQFFGLSMIWGVLRGTVNLEAKDDDETNSEGYWRSAGMGGGISKNNWIGPDGTESGPDVPEDWYLTYDGPAPIVKEIYNQNYAVDRGNGTIPIDFYIKTWGIPDDFGKTDYEKLWSTE